MTATWIVAVEYTGADLEPCRPARRRAIVQHAYDLETGLLADGHQGRRVGFERPTRGWPAATALPRCPACTRAVTISVAAAIAGVLGRGAAGLGRWAVGGADPPEDVELWAPPPHHS